MTRKQKGSIYSCVNCGAELFAEINLVQHRIKHNRDDCDTSYIEPQRWIIEALSPERIALIYSYALFCPNCNYQLGTVKL